MTAQSDRSVAEREEQRTKLLSITYTLVSFCSRVLQVEGVILDLHVGMGEKAPSKLN